MKWNIFLHICNRVNIPIQECKLMSSICPSQLALLRRVIIICFFKHMINEMAINRSISFSSFCTLLNWFASNQDFKTSKENTPKE